jgi:hypothetical protein
MRDAANDRIEWTNSSGTIIANINYDTGTNRFTINHSSATASVGLRLLINTESYDFTTTDFDLFGKDIVAAGDVALDSLTKDAAGDIAVNDNFDMNSNSILECAQITPVSNNSGTVGTAALTYNTGYILNMVCGSLTADNGTSIVVDDHLDPNADNSFRLGHNGGNAARWSNISAVLTDFGDIGFHNKWKFREWPATQEDVQTRSPQWMKLNANQGIQIVNEEEELVAVIHRDGYIYCKGVRPLEELWQKEYLELQEI